jgi:ketosteroid isomerase-like protein
MSKENVEIVRRAIEAVNRRDVEEILSYTDSEAELHSAVIGGAEGNVYRGHDGLRRWFAETDEAFEEIRTDVSEVRDLGDRVLILGRIKALGRESGVPLDSPTGWIFTVRRGRLVKGEGFLSHAEALEAAGLQE